MTYVNRFVLLITLFTLATGSLKADAIAIDLTQISVGINGGFPNIVNGGFSNVASPFQNSVSRTILQSTAQASYDFNWTVQMASFLIDSSISCQGPVSAASFRCGSTGQIAVTTTSDVILHSDVGLSWNLAPGDRQGILDFDVIRIGSPNTTIHNRSFGHSNINGGPPNGSFGYLDSTLLPAGGQYVLLYAINFTSFNGSPTALSTGTSHIGLHLEPVPEPATLGLLALAALPLIRRNRR